MSIGGVSPLMMTLGVSLLSSFLFCRFDSLPIFVLHEFVTKFLAEFFSCSSKLCAWRSWRG